MKNEKLNDLMVNVLKFSTWGMGKALSLFANFTTEVATNHPVSNFFFFFPVLTAQNKNSIMPCHVGA